MSESRDIVPFVNDGRPRKLTYELIASYRKLLPRALHIDVVSAALNVDRTTLYRWLRRGRVEELRLMKEGEDAKPLASELIFLDFYHTHKEIDALCEMLNIGAIVEAAKKDWKAAAWLAPRRWPDRWSDHKRELRVMQKQMEGLLRELAELRSQQEGIKDPERDRLESTIRNLQAQVDTQKQAQKDPEIDPSAGA